MKRSFFSIPYPLLAAVTLQLACMPLAGADTIPDGTLSTIIGVNAGLCLGPEGASSGFGAKLQSQNCNGSSFQQWQMVKDSANYYQIINSGSGLCIDVTDGATNAGAKLQQWGCSGADYQKWNISDQGNGQYALVSKYNNLVIDVAGANTADGASIIQWSWLGANNQKWTFPGASIAVSDPLDGSVAALQNVKVNNCLGVSGHSSANGALLESQGCDGSGFQSWQLVSDSNGYYQLMNQGSGKCIDVPAGSSVQGLQMQQWACYNGDYQKWSLADQGSGNYFITSKYTGQVLDVAGASSANGADVIQWPAKSSGNENQLWSMVTSSGGNTPEIIGFAAGTTGGAGGEVVTVTTPGELSAVISDNTPRIIRISGIIDFRNTEGSSTELGCTYSDNYCSYNGKQEKILNFGSYCSGRTTYNITYDTAGKTPLQVGSNKTLIGVGSNSGIKGKGLRMSGGVSNIIVRNLSITDINDGVIWGGDAITLTGTSNIWIDHNYIARIGRQFLVTGWDTAQNVTFSNNYLDGQTDYGHYCDQRHYWNLLLVAENQSITLANNRFHMTSGRAPKFGKQDTASTAGILHIVNNYWDDNYAEGFSGADGTAIMEGNYFANGNNFTPISGSSTNMPLYAPLDSSMGSANSYCQSVLGRSCAANYDANGSSNFVINSSAMSSLQQNSSWLNAVKSVTPQSYSTVQSMSFGPQSSISY